VTLTLCLYVCVFCVCVGCVRVSGACACACVCWRQATFSKYIKTLQKEMHNDSVQSMEYTITNPLLSAILVASISPTVPTGMVQLLFVCLLASHLLCTPILYLSHLTASYSKKHGSCFHADCMKWGIGLLLGACILLQCMGFTIQMIYVTRTWDYYTVDGLLSGCVWFLLAMQVLFMLTIVFVAVSSILTSAAFMERIADLSSVTYTCINLLIRFAIGIMLAVAAYRQQFPVFSCDIWEGQFAAPVLVLA